MLRHPFFRILLTAGLFVLPLAVMVALFAWQWQERRKEIRFDKEIAAAAARYKIDPALIKAVIWQESRFKPNVVGAAGEIGLMQIMEPAALEWADAEKLHDFDHRQLFEPTRNIHAGAWYLAKLLKRYPNADNPLPYALADYNAGRTHVLRWNKGPAATNSAAFLAAMDYPGTRQYALNIMDRYKRYAQSRAQTQR